MKKVLIDAGHGGVFDGWYCTAGKRSPEPPPAGIFEGAFNREVAWLLTEKLRASGVPAVFLNPGPLDAPESAKASYGRAAVKQFGAPNLLWLSLHCNASPRPGWDEGARGATIFVKRNDAKSEAVAAKILGAWCSATGLSPTRGVQKKGFNILFGTSVSALLEMGFMTSRADLSLMRNGLPAGVDAMAEVIEGWCADE